MQTASKIRRLLCLAALAAALPLPAAAQEPAFPTKPITVVVPFSPGGGVDVMARLLGEKLRESLGQPVVVENKPGASGMLGALAVVRAPADGYTLLIGSAGETAINPFIYKDKMQYAPDKDLAPITPLVRVPNVLVATPNAPFNTVDELVDYAKKNPGKLGYGTSGVGNPQHLNGELLEQLAGIDMLHIPYRGAAGQLADVAGGTVELAFVSMTAAGPFISGGRVKALAVTSAKRAAFAPDLPAIAESKAVPAYALENWFGVFATAGTPAAVIERLNAAVVQALKSGDLAARMTEQGGIPSPMSPQEFRDFIKTEAAQYKRIVEVANITPND